MSIFGAHEVGKVNSKFEVSAEANYGDYGGYGTRALAALALCVSCSTRTELNTLCVFVGFLLQNGLSERHSASWKRLVH